MDIVVADIPPRFGMLLSRSWIKRLGGTLKMDLTYANVLVFGGEQRRLYREAQLAYIISDRKYPTNHLYARTTGVGSSILHMDDFALPTKSFQILKPAENQINHEGSNVWIMFFMSEVPKKVLVQGLFLFLL